MGEPAAVAIKEEPGSAAAVETPAAAAAVADDGEAAKVEPTAEAMKTESVGADDAVKTEAVKAEAAAGEGAAKGGEPTAEAMKTDEDAPAAAASAAEAKPVKKEAAPVADEHLQTCSTRTVPAPSTHTAHGALHHAARCNTMIRRSHLKGRLCAQDPKTAGAIMAVPASESVGAVESEEEDAANRALAPPPGNLGQPLDPYADTRKWVAILAQAASQPLALARESFEQVVSMFPTAGQYWRCVARPGWRACQWLILTAAC